MLYHQQIQSTSNMFKLETEQPSFLHTHTPPPQTLILLTPLPPPSRQLSTPKLFYFIV